MPPINHAMASAGVAAVALTFAAAVAIYESEEVRQVVNDIRRRLAVALRAIENEVNPAPRNRQLNQPLFNRPEDAEGFLQSRAGEGVDADEATRKQQRDELMYWNAIRESKLLADATAAAEKAVAAAAATAAAAAASSSTQTFDDFLRQEEGSAAGTLVYNTGADVGNREGIRRRTQNTAPAHYANPFADEHHIETDIDETPSESNKPDSDMYHATPLVMSPAATPAATPAVPAVPNLPQASVSPPEDTASSSASYASANTPRSASPVADLVDVSSNRSETLSGTAVSSQAANDGFATTSEGAEAYSSIQAWAQGTQQPDFYSPLPMSPEPPASEPEALSDGQLTPTDSMSIVDVDNEMERTSNPESRDYDVISESDGIPTPSSWSEIGSAVSGSESPMHG